MIKQQVYLRPMTEEDSADCCLAQSEFYQKQFYISGTVYGGRAP